MRRLLSPLLVLYLLFFLSGAAALGYQLIWTKMFAVGLGHEMASVLGVICAFMGGMSLGSWFIGRAVAWPPTHMFGIIELTIGGWGSITALALPPVNEFALHLSGLGSPLRQWLVCFALPFIALLPATMAMGASFPAMERCIAALRATKQTVPGVYAMNTFGAVAGTYLSIFVIAPRAGLRGTLFWLAAINLLCGIVALALAKVGRACPQRAADPDLKPTSGALRTGGPYHLSKRRLMLALFFTGLFGMAVETVAVRVLAQVLENTVYTFATVLAVFLLGTAAGAAILHRWARAPSPGILTALLTGVALSSLLSIVLLREASPLYEFFPTVLGGSTSGMLIAEMLVALITIGPPTLFMGATFSVLAQAWRDSFGNVARAAAINTAGAAISPLLFSVLILPLIGAKWTLVLVAAGYFTLIPVFKRILLAAFGMVLIAIAFFPRDLRTLDLPPQGKVLDYRDGIMASVAVVEDATRHRTLRVNNHFQMGGTGPADAEYRHAHIPLLLHANPQRALILGVGTGITLGGATVHPNLRIDGVELLPEVVDVMPQFEPYNRSPGQNGSVRLYTADARRFVKVTQQKYDVIVADLFHPAADGAGSLYTLEHFRSLRERLAPNGICCQWLPLHQLDLSMFRVITKTFLQVFPNTHAWLLRFNVDAPVIGLIGTIAEERYPTNWIEQRLADNSLASEIKRLGLADSIRFFGNYLAGPRELSGYSAGTPINTDDRPVVIFRAPKFAYQKNHTTYGRLMLLLRDLKPNPSELLKADAKNQFTARLNAYFAARNVYIGGLAAEAESLPDKATDAFVESARVSSDFTAGYAQCLTTASLEARSNPAKARRLLERLIEAQPSRPVAREMLTRLFEPAR